MEQYQAEASRVGRNSHVNDPTLTKMLEDQLRTLDQDKRRKTIRDIQLYLADKVYYMPLALGYTYDLRNAHVRDYVPSAVGFNEADLYRYVWLDQ